MPHHRPLPAPTQWLPVRGVTQMGADRPAHSRITTVAATILVVSTVPVVHRGNAALKKRTAISQA